MTGWEAVLLGIIQGLTEFLPVSSSGHLVLGKAVLGIEIEDIAFEIFVHFGTLLAVLTIFKEDIIILLKGLKSLVLFQFRANRLNKKCAGKEGIHLLGLLTIGTLPAAIFGFIFQDTVEEAFSHPEFVYSALIVTGLILFTSRFTKEKHFKFTFLKSLVVGLAQVAAIFPGISRSGTTITAGLHLGIQRVESARFSFLLAVPLILGATLLQSMELISQLPSKEKLLQLLIGTTAAYISGLFAIKWLLGIIQQGRFDRFAYYCFAVGILGLILSNI